MAPEITRFRMLVLGDQLPFRNGFDIRPNGATKWIQSGYTAGRDASERPTVVGECTPLPADEWERFEHGVQLSGILEVEGNPYYPSFHQPTWYFDIQVGNQSKRLKAYGAEAMKVLRVSSDVQDLSVWAVALAISEVDLFELRVPWIEHLEIQSILPPPESLADLPDIAGPFNPGVLQPPTGS
ncbi:MAG TPA: hypothetical protein DEV93_10925 [Chloroflexi bacterium]|nr:hypothetical protein [Chloroflexota bacterium]